ncbi:TPA: hypothetical protein JTP48_003408 [Escherichia coli]|nr:hypothetical protein [Escherichia coli]
MNSIQKDKYSVFCRLLNETLKYKLRLILPPGHQAVIPLPESPRGEISRDTIEKMRDIPTPDVKHRIKESINAWTEDELSYVEYVKEQKRKLFAMLDCEQ